MTSLPGVTVAPNATLGDTIEQHLPHSFAQLGDAFFTRVPPAPLPEPYLVGFSADAAALLGWPAAAADDPAFLALFSGNAEHAASQIPGARPQSLATVYSGHQFGVWAGQLGDGRALLLGEIEHGGNRHEVQLKGAGLTPYSRMGDGRAVLRSSIREFLCSEAMHYLGIPATRALCVIGSDLVVRREERETAAVVTRLAPSFVRFGHFEHFQAHRDADGRPRRLAQLADHVIARLFPEALRQDNPYLAMFDTVTRRTAELIAQWQAVGFCHGVMNTDNMSILGLTIDYGPFGFLDGYDAGHICNHSDNQGRYAYRAQPQAAHWNLFCLAKALVSLAADASDPSHEERTIAEIQRILDSFKSHFTAALEHRMQAKFGLATTQEGDAALRERLFEIMQANRADFTLTFRNLARVSKLDARGDMAVRDLFLDRAGFDAWAVEYRIRLGHEAQDDAARAAAMNRVNPKYILRNHLAEQAIRHAKQSDFAELARLLEVLRHPFDEQPEHDAYAALPPDWASSLEVSCSS